MTFARASNYLSFWQNVAAGFSLRWHRLESLCHQASLKQLRRISSLKMNFARLSFDKLFFFTDFFYQKQKTENGFIRRAMPALRDFRFLLSF